MKNIAAASLLLLFCCTLRAASQMLPYRYGATVLGQSCPTEAEVRNQTRDPAVSSVLSNIAARIASGRGTCLEKIYVYAFTSSLRYAETSSNHEIEVIGPRQTKKISLPNRPSAYTLHKGDMWKLDIVQDFGFFRGTCLRPCNIRNVSIEEEGNNGWNIDSIMTYGCAQGLGCTPLTQDIDVFRWVDGDGALAHLRFPLTKVSQSLCA